MRQKYIIIAAVIIAIAGWLMGVEALAQKNTQPFQVFDAVKYRNKPDSHLLGLTPIQVIYTASMWPRGDSRDEPHEATLRAYAKELKNLGSPVVIDIEHWPVRGESDAVINKNIEKLSRFADILADARPDLLFGYYRLAPTRDYWTPVRNLPDSVKKWQEANRRMQALADHVDAVFPSLYTFYKDVQGWETYARANIAEARQYGKPIYPFIWPEYHDSNKALAGTFLSPEFWRRQLDLCRQLTDGVVIWGGSKGQWDDNAAWWLATKEFLRELKKDGGQ